MLLIAAPGQGAQSPGFLLEWLELPEFSERIGSWSELAGIDLIRFGTTAGADEITDTAVAQPLLVAAALAAAAELVSLAGPQEDLAGAAVAAGTDAAAGHSVGELAAGAIAGAITPQDAVRLVRVRGQAMAKAAAATATGMTAVLGGDEAEVLARIRACGLTAANINGPGQIVAGGTTAELAAFAAEPPAGARLRPLQVAGAFHTPYMAAAAEALRAAAATVAPRNPVLALLSNHDGRVVRGGQDWLSRIVAQVDTPVRWDKCMRAMAALGVTAMIELPPAGTLTGLARRALPGVRVLALKSPADLVHAQEMLAADPAGPADDAHAPEWRLLVAPLGGTFRACERNDVTGAAIGTGAELGHVEIRGDTQPISCAFPATIVEWLVEDGDLVTAGQPIVRLQPQASADTPR